jgi:carboxylesterase type B
MIWSLLGLWLWSTLLLQVSTQESSVPTSHIVDTGYARYQGTFTAPFSVAYLGVPYAAPPLGSLRFRAPQSLDIAALRKDRDSGKINDATAYPDFCVQGSTGEGDAGGAGSEDCLKVNVFAPVNATSTSKCKSSVLVHEA